MERRASPPVIDYEVCTREDTRTPIGLRNLYSLASSSSSDSTLGSPIS